MSITVFVPGTLRGWCRDHPAELVVPAATVYASLEHSHPPLYRSVRDETGAIRRHVNLLVNNALVYDRHGLDTALESGVELTIMSAVSEG